MKFTFAYLLADLKKRPFTTVGSTYMIGVTSFTLISLWGLAAAHSDGDDVGATVASFIVVFLFAATMLASSLGAMLSDLYRRRSDEFILLLGYGMTERGLLGMNLLRDLLALLIGIPISGGLSAVLLKGFEYIYNRAGASLKWVSLLSDFTDDKPNHIEIEFSFMSLLIAFSGILLVVLLSNYFAWRSGIKQLRARYRCTVNDDRRVIDRRAADITDIGTYMAVGRRRTKRSAFFAGSSVFFGMLLPLLMFCTMGSLSGEIKCFPDASIESESAWESDLMTSDEVSRLISIDGIVSYDMFDDTIRGESYRSEQVEDGHLYHLVRFILPDEGWEEIVLELAKLAAGYGLILNINKINEVDSTLSYNMKAGFFLILSLILYIAVSVGNYFTVGCYLDGRCEEFAVLRMVGLNSADITGIKRDAARRILFFAGEAAAVFTTAVYVILSTFGGDVPGLDTLEVLASVMLFTAMLSVIAARVVAKKHKEGDNTI